MEKTITLSVGEYNALVDKARLNREIIAEAFQQYAQDLEDENTNLKMRLEEATSKKPSYINPWDIKFMTRIKHGMQRIFGKGTIVEMMDLKKVNEL